ncbi:caspase family protein [Streptomyces sp. NPDC001273]|uniref:caspase family protein n=1 Tax=unclassified Streptomyces TaxID=2593676 RepID=UPI0033C84641
MTGPTAGSQEGEGPRRYLIATAVSRYPKCAEWDRPGLVQAREQIVELFTEKLGYRLHTALGVDPTRVQLTDQLRAFCTSDERREDDLVVVYLSGHGEVLEDGSEHVLLMADTDPADVTYTALPTADLVRVLRGTRIRRLLLILDTCYSGQGGNELAAAALERLGTQWGQGKSSSGLVIMSSAQPQQQAQAGLFPRLLGEAVRSQATAGHAPTHLSVSAVVQQMNDHADKPGYQHISLSLLGLTGEPPDFLTNPRHDVRLTDVDLALQDAAEFDAYALQRETEFTSRLLVRAMGYHGDAAQGWWFCGRHQALAEVAAWLNQEDDAQAEIISRVAGADGSLRVVTAGPGSGKTAVLGLLAALATPERRRTVPVDQLGLDPDWIPHEGSIDVVMYAQNLTNTQVLSGLAAAAGFKCATLGEFLNALEQCNVGRGRPFTVLIDALDEAATPDTLCSHIVRPLIEHSRGRIRLLLGTRPYLLDRLDISSDPEHLNNVVIDLDSPRYADHEALLAYTMRNLLQSRRTSPYRSADPQLLRQVAQAVGDAAGTSFLVARFAAYTLASAESVVADPDSAGWRASLPRHAGQAMHDDLTRRLGPEAQRAADLLRPLAYAEGQGLPWEGIWAPLASAISGRTYTDEDLLWLRRNAGSYVVEATENSRSAYRLYHQALAERLREKTNDTAIHSAIVDTLIEDVPYRGDATRDWSRAHPYTLNHLATHSAAAHRVDDVLAIPEYLVHAVPTSLTPHLDAAVSQQAQLTAAVYRTSFDWHVAAPVPVRRSILALNAARAQATWLLRQLNSGTQAEWVPAWATSNDFSPALRHTLTGFDAQVAAVACTVLDGHPVAVIGTAEGRVHVRDVASGHPIGEPLTGFGGRVSAVACTVLDGRPVAVISSDAQDGSRVHVRDVATGRPVGEPLTGFNRQVTTVVCTVLDGRPVAVIGTVGGAESHDGRFVDRNRDDGGRVHVRDVATGRPICEPLTGFMGRVSALACTVLDGRPVAVISSGTGTGRRQSRNGGRLLVRDVATGQPVGKPLTAFAGPVTTLACTVVNNRPVAVIGTGGSGGRVYVRDVATGHHIGSPLTGFGSRVSALACTVLGNRPVAVIGTGTGTNARVYVRDLETGQLVGGPLPGFNSRFTALACTALDGRPLAVTGSSDRTVRVWNLLENSQPSAMNAIPASPLVSTLACTVLDDRPIAVMGTNTSRDSGRVDVRDVATGHLIGERQFEFGRRVTAVACTVLDDRPIAVVGAGGRVYSQDVATGRPIRDPLIRLQGLVSALTCTVFNGRPITVIGTSQPRDGVGQVHVHDVATGNPVIEPFSGFAGPVTAIACTAVNDRPVAVIGSDTGLKKGDRRVDVRDVATGLPIGEPLTGLPGRVYALACTALDDRPITVIGAGGRAYMHDVATDRCTDLLSTGRHGWVSSVACTVLDGRPLAVISAGSTLGVWDLRTRKLVERFVVPSLAQAAVAQDGSLVVSLRRDVAVFRRTGTG